MKKLGIDVSSYQGKIDWKKVKDAGVDFAILKIIRKDLNPDNQFENNWNGCISAGVPIQGVYNYSYATSVEKARSDAKKVLQILNGRKTMVWLDAEDDCMKKLGRKLFDIINAYEEVIKNAGLEFGVYTGQSFYNSYIKPYGTLKCHLWIARYYDGYKEMNFGKLPNEAYEPVIANESLWGWQLTSSGKIDGINGHVDFDISYYDVQKSEISEDDSDKRFAQKVIEQSRLWIGKNENDGTHKEIIDIYNSHYPLARGYKVKYSDYWCATFVSAVAIKLGYFDIIPTECSCEQMIKLLKKIGCWVEDDSYIPNPGDIIFYDWQDNGSGDNTGRSDHVGYVESIDGKNMVIIEGNFKNSVGRRNIKVNDKFIRGYGTPRYDEESQFSTGTISKKTIDEIVQEVIEGTWGVGSERKRRLICAGYDYTAVQALVNQIMLKNKYYPKYFGNSQKIDEVFRSIGVPQNYIGNKTKRKPVADSNGIKNYNGTAGQNLTMISLAKLGKLKKA